MGSFTETVSGLTGLYSAFWSDAGDILTFSLRRFSPRVKAEKEREVELLLEKGLPGMDRHEEMEEGERARYLGRAHTALGRLMMGEGDPSVDRFFSDCESAGKQFVTRSREFDPALSEHDIHQALRNQWVFNSIQSYLSHPVTLTSSSLGYSLMYPYTDNRLDGSLRTIEEKDRFNESLKACLTGEPELAADGDAPGFRGLLRMIEQEYPRDRYPAGYESLLAIYSAQRNSLILHGTVDDMTEPYLRSLTVEKGGTSVAVDGYLVSGTLGPGELRSLFGYGVVLQFIDDLQDIPEDTASGHSTMFSRATLAGPLDAMTGRLMNFTCDTVRALGRAPSGTRRSLAGLIEGSCLFLILEAVARYSHLYSAGYVRGVEEFSPLRFSYLAGLHDRLKTALATREGALFPA